MSILLAKFGAGLLRGLSVALPIPLFVIIAVAAWLWIDTGSRVRQAVNRATAELVAGGKIKALEAQLAAERDLRQFIAGERAVAEQLAADAQESLATYEQDLNRTRQENEIAEKELEELRQNPRAAIADDGYVDRMRDR